MTKTILAYLFLAIGIIGVVILQIFMSKSERKWPGFILPAITFCLSIMAVFGIIYLSPVAAWTAQSYKTILETVQIPRLADFIESLFVFILYNIPTAVFFGIYYASRVKIHRQSEYVKMSLQDLE